MNDVPVFFCMNDDNAYWLDMPRERALAWTEVLLRHRPSTPSTMMRLVRPQLDQGIPAGFTDWARRAHVAESIRLGPEEYDALQTSLDGIDPTEFPAHPDNHLVDGGLVPARPFDMERWAIWWLLSSWRSPLEATRSLLESPVGGPGGRAGPAPTPPDDELSRLIDVADFPMASEVVISAPHAGSAIPLSCLPSFTVSKAELAQEHQLLADHQTDRIASLAGVVSRISTRLSRLVVDVERFEGDAEEMNRVGMGALYTRGTAGQPLRTIDDDDERARLLTHSRVYGELCADLVDRVLVESGRAVILDLHSYPKDPLPYELHQEDRRPELCIGVDPMHSPPMLVDAVRSAFAGWDMAVNQPFKGTYVPLRHLRNRLVWSVMLEIRRDRYLSADAAAEDEAIREIARRVRTLVALIKAQKP